MPDLDDANIYTSLDPTGLSARLSELPGQCSEAWSQVKQAELPDFAQARDHVVICGMGGSAIAGDLAADLAEAQASLPITVVRDFGLPFTRRMAGRWWPLAAIRVKPRKHCLSSNKRLTPGHP